MTTITISGRVVVTDDENDEKPITDPRRLKSFAGLNSGKETCSKYHAEGLADLGLKGGVVKLVFDEKSKKLRVVSEFTSSRKLTASELKELVEDTVGQWSDGIGEGCFDDVMDKRNVFIDLAPLTGGKPTVTQVDDGKTPPKPKKPREDLAKIAATGDLEKVKQRVEAKTNLDVRGKNGLTPLIAAIAGNHTDVALYLIEKGADPRARDKWKSDPLTWAARQSGWVKKHQNVKLAEALLAAGAEVDSRDKSGFTPLTWAANRRAVRLVEFLIDRGADVNARTTEKGNANRTPLMYAQGIAVVRVLLAAGADPKAIDDGEMHTWEFHAGAAVKLLKERAGVK